MKFLCIYSLYTLYLYIVQVTELYRSGGRYSVRHLNPNSGHGVRGNIMTKTVLKYWPKLWLWVKINPLGIIYSYLPCIFYPEPLG